MASIVETERDTYQSIWALPAYTEHSPGEQYVPIFLDMTQTHMKGSVLDAGCGAGKGAFALRAAGFQDVTLCDLTPAGLLPEAKHFYFLEAPLWSDLARQIGFREWVYCCDVLEHIPTPFTMLVVQRLLDVARRGVFLSIALVPDQFGAWVGKPLHQTVQSFTSWRDQLSTLGELVESRDLLNAGVYLLKPRC